MSRQPRNLGIMLAFGAVVSVLLGSTALAVDPGTPWPATDALSRSIPEPVEVPQTQTDRFVGIFYFLWNHRARSTLPNDLSRILPQDPDLARHALRPGGTEA